MAKTKKISNTPPKNNTKRTIKKSTLNNNNISANMSKQRIDPGLHKFFADALKDIYWAEKKLVSVIPKLHKSAYTDELKNAFADHLEVTKGQVEKLEKVFSLMGQKAEAKKCEAMLGITDEGIKVIEQTDKNTTTRDAALIMTGQKVEHYEIATYGGLVHLAQTLQLKEISDLLQSILEEEKEADRLLTEISENIITYKAVEED